MNAFFPLSLVAAAILTGCAQIQNASEIATVALPTADGVTRRAVVFGLDHVDTMAYGGWDGACPGTIEDATRMRAFLAGRGYSVTFLTNSMATSYRVVSSATAACQGLKAGDRLVVYGSSHGGQVTDVNGDEGGGKDSTVCLWDGQFVDDLVWVLLCRVTEGVEVALVIDACNTGTTYRAPHNYARVMSARASRAPGVLSCSVIYMGGCGDGQYSYGGAAGGVFTSTLLSGFADGMTWAGLAAEVAAKMPRNQVPTFSELGGSTKDREAFK